MINIALKKNQKFSNNNHLGIFYAIVDVYQNEGRSINDTEMVQILKDKYGIDIERRTIKRYRDFLDENFDINLVYYKKGYYIDNRSEEDKENEKKEEIIERAIEESNDSYKWLNIEYDHQSFEVLPIDIHLIDGEKYLVGVIEEDKYRFYCFKLSKIVFKSPVYLENYCDFSPDLEQIVNYGYPFEGDLGEAPDSYSYTIESTLVFKENAPVKEIKKKIKNVFDKVESKIVTVKGEKHKALYIAGDNLELAAFTIKMRTRGYLKAIIGDQVKDEIRVMFGIH